ncbi:ATP-binding protein [Dyadobacter fermentans]|nr:DUF4118 domain-containing protein [Dyadobacter fermentans]
MQYTISIVSVLFVASLCYVLKGVIGYKLAALVLLMTVSVIAALFEILPVTISALSSSFILNFFFIPPLYTFRIGNAEDLLMFFLYFAIALVNAVLTSKIRKAERRTRDREEKENTIRLYTTLLNSLSHELRTPISTILGAVDTLSESSPKLSRANQETLLSEIYKAGLRLDRQVGNLLSMSRLESGTLQPKKDWCDLNDLVHSVLQKLPQDNKHPVNYCSNESLPLFKVDEGFTEQILYNLLHNAIQYTPEGSPVRIRIAHGSGSCIIIVSDSGPGFPEYATQLVFDKFYRLPHSKPGGSGLGLSIVRGFVEALGGSIQLENAARGGAVFTIMIPAETSYLNNLKNE